MRYVCTLAVALLVMVLSACATDETPVAGIGDANSAAPAPTADPISGTWTGDWGPNPAQRHMITLALNWDGMNLGGAVEPGPNAVAITKASFAPDTGTLSFEATGNGEGGKVIRYAVDGKVSEGTITGTWTEDGKTGDLTLKRK